MLKTRIFMNGLKFPVIDGNKCRHKESVYNTILDSLAIGCFGHRTVKNKLS